MSNTDSSKDDRRVQSEIFGMLHQKVGRTANALDPGFGEELDPLIKSIGDAAELTSGSGFLGVMGAALGWPAWFFEGTDLPAGSGVPARLTIADQLTLLANVADYIGPGAILTMLARHAIHANDPAAQAVLLSAPTAHHALDYAVRALNLQSSVAVLTIEHSNEWVKIDVRASFGGRTGKLYEALHALMLATVCDSMHFGSHANAIELPSMSIASSDPCWFEEASLTMSTLSIGLGIDTTLSVDRRRAEEANPRYTPVRWTAALDVLAKREDPTSANPLVQRVDARLRKAILEEGRILSSGDVARLEVMSERTLFRRLASAGARFQNRVNSVREECAQVLLADQALTVGEVATRLGFSHASSFARAFSMWTGMAPSAWQLQSLRVR